MKNTALYLSLENKINTYNLQNGNILSGILDPIKKDVFIRQLIDSIRRVKYVETVRSRTISPERADPNNNLFDPIKGACYLFQQGNFDEANWLIFLSTHFGIDPVNGWKITKNLYGKLGQDGNNKWSWGNVSNNLNTFLTWLDNNSLQIKDNAKFGNHRRYQSISATSNAGTGATITSYVNLIGNSHSSFFSNIIEDSPTPRILFNRLYRIYKRDIKGFSRLGTFDFLCMLGKSGILNIEPDTPYLKGASGPLTGARMLYNLNGQQGNASSLESYLINLETHLQLSFGMQVLEDALCNWQKNPAQYIYFNG
ncbi:hypothetical protein [Chryseobacterium jejuense]|uniref:alpha-glutamyl/putrescinyl thymine pyrophosphorylase clade 3 protein n=1 Tax=Chryseobacterium jejuense TaxID=445960 RepID=UPI001AE80BA3|nr:hypothetical protein [Chryseobacterium jejuense]MBP2619116.1 hypothetical protein [Chryseobacterium jejuense]